MRSPSALRLLSLGSAPCPEGAVLGGAVTDARALGSALSALFAESGVGPESVLLALKGSCLFVRRLSMPPVEAEELAELVSWELEQLLPWALEETNFDYWVEGSGREGEGQEVVVTAVRREVLAGYQAALEAAGLEVVAVDHTSFVLANTFHLCFESDPVKVIALLDLGASATSIHLLQGDSTLAVRDEPIGGRAVVEHLAGRCGTSAETIEEFLKGERAEAVDPGVAQMALQEAADGVADRLLKTVDALGYGPGGTPIADVVLGGGLARIPTVERCISEKLGAPTELLNPFLNLEYDEARWNHDQLQQSAPSMAVAVGLALRALRESGGAGP